MPTLIQCSTNCPSRYAVTRLISWDPRCAFYEFVPSFPIYGWLAWWCDFFPVGPTFEEFSQKKVQPLGLDFWHLCLGLLKSLFCWRSWTYVFAPFCGDKWIFSKKENVLQFGCALTQNSRICPIIPYLWRISLVMRLFPCGANLWRSPASIQPKNGPAPWVLFLTPAPRPLQATFLVGEAEHMCPHPFARQMCLQLYKFWASRSVEFSGLNGIVRVCYYFWPLNLHFTFWERPFVTSNMHLEINILCLTYANSAL